MTVRKILVVDDEESISSYLRRKLTKLGYEVRVADDGEKAIHEALAYLPDVILLDVKLPKMTGTEVCKRLKSDEKTKGIVVLMLSARAQAVEIKEGLNAGAHKYLCKPISFPDILTEIRACEKE